MPADWRASSDLSSTVSLCRVVFLLFARAAFSFYCWERSSLRNIQVSIVARKTGRLPEKLSPPKWRVRRIPISTSSVSC
jgi:hypothetical protein